MGNHGKKFIAPIIIIVCSVLYYILIGIVLIAANEVHLLIKIPSLVIPIALVGVSIFVLVERINEIRSGEEDDLSKY